jgi:hypothetical protein
MPLQREVLRPDAEAYSINIALSLTVFMKTVSHIAQVFALIFDGRVMRCL